MKNLKKKNSGITLMELIIVLAIIAVITAIVAVNLFGTTDRARLRSDIQSTLVLRNAAEIFRIGGREVPPDFAGLADALYDNYYINFEVAYNSPQTFGATWEIFNNIVYLVLPADFDLNITFLNDNERNLIHDVQAFLDN